MRSPRPFDAEAGVRRAGVRAEDRQVDDALSVLAGGGAREDLAGRFMRLDVTRAGHLLDDADEMDHVAGAGERARHRLFASVVDHEDFGRGVDFEVSNRPRRSFRANDGEWIRTRRRCESAQQGLAQLAIRPGHADAPDVAGHVRTIAVRGAASPGPAPAPRESGDDD